MVELLLSRLLELGRCASTRVSAPTTRRRRPAAESRFGRRRVVVILPCRRDLRQRDCRMAVRCYRSAAAAPPPPVRKIRNCCRISGSPTRRWPHNCRANAVVADAGRCRGISGSSWPQISGCAANDRRRAGACCARVSRSATHSWTPLAELCARTFVVRTKHARAQSNTGCSSWRASAALCESTRGWRVEVRLLENPRPLSDDDNSAAPTRLRIGTSRYAYWRTRGRSRTTHNSAARTGYARASLRVGDETRRRPVHGSPVCAPREVRGG